MKKLYTFALLAAVAMPAYATDTDLGEETLVNTSDAEIVSDSAVTDADITEIATPTNPDIKFPHGLQLGVGVSVTGGLDGFVGYANKNFDSFWLKRFGVRLDFATTAPLKSAINSGLDSVIGDGIDIGDELTIGDAGIKGHHFAALIDFYPFGNTWFLGGIRISGGYYWGNLELNAALTGAIDALPDSEFAFELDGKNYKYTGNEVNATATANWDYNGPYLGAGFDLGLFAGLKIYFDAGVVFTSKTAQLGLDVPLNGLQVFENGNWTSVADNGFLVEELDSAKQATLSDAQSELDKLQFYPIVKLGFMYRF